MSSQKIIDYLTKQIFVEKSIVTYRSLSRQFSIHVNAARNELATYHHDAPYQLQSCSATFLITGVPRPIIRSPSSTQDDDVNMEASQSTVDDEWEEEDGDEVSQTKILLVNERDLQVAKSTFDQIFSIYVYSLSPSPLNDADLICTPTEFVRNTDKEKGPQLAAAVGRIVTPGLKPGVFKKRPPPPVPIAGPSKSKESATETKAATKTDTKEKASEKPKQTGKLDFFKKVEKSKDTRDTGKGKEVKQEPTDDSKKKLFFSNPKATSKATRNLTSPMPAEKEERKKEWEETKETEKEKEKETPARGVKRKSSVDFEEKGKSSKQTDAASSTSKKAIVAETDTNVRIKRKVVLSSDESESMSTRTISRKPRKSTKTESVENSEGEKEAMALMDIDDADVERVSRVPSTAPSVADEDVFEDDIGASESGDVSMTDEASLKRPKTVVKRKPKTVVPVGRNGLKKKKVTKTRKRMDENGYMIKEDYSEWESVASDDPEPPAPKTIKAKAKAVKEEDNDAPLLVKKEKVKVKVKVKVKESESEKSEPTPAPKKASTKQTAKPKPVATKGGVKTQKGLMNFFGPKKT